MKIDLDALLAHSFKFAKKQLLEHGELQPMFVLLDAAGEMQIVPATWSDEHEKVMFLAAMRALMKQFRTVAYCQMSEAWMAEADGRDPAVNRLQPSQRDTRKEVVVACVADHLKSTVQVSEIIRDDAGKVVDFKSITKELPTGFAGRMAELLR